MNYTSTILIVDDDQDGRETLEMLLINQGYRLVFATNGQEALNQAARYSPDLILLDVMMPFINGFEVCRRLRAHPLLSEIPVIVVTSLNDRDARIEALNAGADEFISKPFDRTELRSRVRTITRLNRHRRLMDERTRFEWVVDQADDGFLLVDETDMVRYANRRARLYLNLSTLAETNGNGTTLLDEPTTFLALARKHYRCEPEDMWDTWLNHVHPPVDTASVPPIRYLVRPETPEAHAVWLQVDRLDLPTGSQAGSLVRLRDVSEQISRKRQMWTFHSLVSHKLGSPLTSLLSSLHLLDTGNIKLSETEAKEYISIAFQSVQSLRNQIQEIRTYIQTPALAIRGNGYPMACFPELVQQIGREEGIASLALFGIEQVCNTRLAIPRQGIELILRQLLENARKFHPTGDPCVEVILSEVRDSAVCIQVCDNGRNLTPWHIAQAWTPYYQAEKDFCGQIPGMGLGLAMVATLVWNIGGHYHIANRDPGPGVIVEVVIPAAESLAPVFSG